MFFILAVVVATPIIIGGVAGVAAGYVHASRESEIADAEATLRAIAHRGGVSEPIPFAPTTARVNAPGLVEVQPRTQRPPASPPPFQGALPRPASVEKPVAQAVSTVSAPLLQLPQLPIDFADEPTEEEETIIVSRWETGEAMTKTIKAVWGIKPGGSTAYKNARSRYRNYLKELTA